MQILNKNKKEYIKQLIFRYKDDDISGLSAQITYYLILSFFPFLIFLLNTLSFTPIPTSDFTQNIVKFLPQETSNTVLGIVNEILGARSITLLSVGMLATIWSSSKGISAMIKGLNKAYDYKENRPIWKVKIMGILFTIGLAIIIIFTFLLLIFGQIISDYFLRFLGAKKIIYLLWKIIRYITPFVSMIMIFSLFYKFAPNYRLKFSDVIFGSIFTTLGWLCTSLVFSFYVNNFNSYSKIYGSIGGMIALFVWLYISSTIILVGGEINAIISYYNSNVKTEKYENILFKIPIINKKI
nr:YihY/virulence factor BrkB family protein [Sedimentibacter sp.]